MQAAVNNSGLKPDPFFENLKGWMRPHEVAEAFGLSVWTVYKWKHKGRMLGVPEDLFIKLNRNLFVRTDVLRRWISSQNSKGGIPMNI